MSSPSASMRSPLNLPPVRRTTRRGCVVSSSSAPRLRRVQKVNRSSSARRISPSVCCRVRPTGAAYGLRGGATGVLSAHGLQSMLARLGRRARVMPCSPHRFRRTFALWMLRDGCDLYSPGTLMGHSSLAVLQRSGTLAWMLSGRTVQETTYWIKTHIPERRSSDASGRPKGSGL